mmetsp:Transcript_100885/g.225365  ORF Transcript_100885/g.225365 Transcript_100885/m.225365 type:complete len:244 (+) Transcript_100885:297-1028(+)
MRKRTPMSTWRGSARPSAAWSDRHCRAAGLAASASPARPRISCPTVYWSARRPAPQRRRECRVVLRRLMARAPCRAGLGLGLSRRFSHRPSAAFLRQREHHCRARRLPRGKGASPTWASSRPLPSPRPPGRSPARPPSPGARPLASSTGRAARRRLRRGRGNCAWTRWTLGSSASSPRVAALRLAAAATPASCPHRFSRPAIRRRWWSRMCCRRRWQPLLRETSCRSRSERLAPVAALLRMWV